MEFEAIYTEHFQNVYRYIFSMCRDETLAEEIAQEAFFKALENLDKFDGRCRLFVWLCQIAKNTYFTYLKKQQRHVPQSEIASQLPSTENLEEQLADREMVWLLHRLLHNLEEPYKEVFSLGYLASCLSTESECCLESPTAGPESFSSGPKK